MYTFKDTISSLECKIKALKNDIEPLIEKQNT